MQTTWCIPVCRVLFVIFVRMNFCQATSVIVMTLYALFRYLSLYDVTLTTFTAIHLSCLLSVDRSSYFFRLLNWNSELKRIKIQCFLQFWWHSFRSKGMWKMYKKLCGIVCICIQQIPTLYIPIKSIQYADMLINGYMFISIICYQHKINLNV